MALEDAKIKESKVALENAMAQDLPLDGLVEALEEANKHFKDQMKHATMHLPRAKAKAKAAAAPA
jgi:inorganic pyrophosphatase